MNLINEFRPLIVKAGDNIIAEDQRVRVQGSKNMTLLPDFFIVEIYNLTSEDLAYISDSDMIYVYGKDEGLICSGEVDDMYTRYVRSNSVTTLSVVDGKKFWNTAISKTVAGGTSLKQTYYNIMQGAYVGAYNADDPRLIRGQTYTGRLPDIISTLAKTAHARAYITNGTVFISAPHRAAETIEINPEDVIDDTVNATGVRIVETMVKGYPVGAMVNLDGTEYRLVSQKFDADNFEGPWVSNLLLVREIDLSSEGMEGG